MSSGFGATSPKQEIRRIQLERIKQLLVETDFTLETIAELAGFEHPEYMSVLFKRETGQTPGKYRSQSSRATSGNSLEISGNYLPHNPVNLGVSMPCLAVPLN